MHIGYASQNPHSHYWLLVSHGVRTRADELGAKLTILPASTLDQQITAMHTLIDQRVDVLLLGPVQATGLTLTVEHARSAGIPVVVLAAALRDAVVDSTVHADHRHGAELAAAYVVERCPTVQALCVANDTLALGAVRAIAAAGRTGKILVTGFDASPEALIAINQGRMSASINQPIRAIGWTGADLGYRLATRETVPPLVLKEVALVTRDTLIETALEIVSVLPGVLQDAVERGEALAAARAQIILNQQAMLRELSTPLIPLSDEVMIMPLVGAIDTLRAQQILETLLQGVAERRAKTVIMDITGVQVVDTQVANALIQAAQAVRLLGASVVLTGIRPEIAQTLVSLGVDLSGIVTYGSLQNGIASTLSQYMRGS